MSALSLKRAALEAAAPASKEAKVVSPSLQSLPRDVWCIVESILGSSRATHHLVAVSKDFHRIFSSPNPLMKKWVVVFDCSSGAVTNTVRRYPNLEQIAFERMNHEIPPTRTSYDLIRALREGIAPFDPGAAASAPPVVRPISKLKHIEFGYLYGEVPNDDLRALVERTPELNSLTFKGWKTLEAATLQGVGDTVGQRLKHLKICGGKEIDDGAVRVIAQSFPELVEFHLHLEVYGEEGSITDSLSTLAEKCSKLQRLTLHQCGDDHSLQAFGTHLKNLQSFSATYLKITNAGLNALVQGCRKMSQHPPYPAGSG